MSVVAKRNIQLDILRGVAILLVLGRHLELQRPGGFTGLFADVWFRIGWIGVDLFFVLSGFLIGGLLITELHKNGTIDIGRFLVRRGLKIYPPYFVFITYVALMPVVKAGLHGNDAWAALTHHWAALWPNLLFLQNYVGSNPIGHTWTLAVEEHFYLLLPFLIAGLVAAKRVHWLVPLAILIGPLCLLLRCLSVWTEDMFSTTLAATHLRLDALFFGVAIRGFAQYRPERFLATRHYRGWLVLAGVILWLPHAFVSPTGRFVGTFGLTGTFLGSAAFLLAVYHTHAADFGRYAALFSRVASLLAWIGFYSYAIYLWHVTVMGILERIVGGRLMERTGEPSATVWLLCALTICAGAVLAGAVASKLVEWPVLRLRDRFFPSRSGAMPVDSAIRMETDDSVGLRPTCSRVAVSGEELGS